MKHIDRLYDEPTIPDFAKTGWIDRHHDAIWLSRKGESEIVSLISGWLRYADTHRSTYDSKIGDDGVLGKEWERIGHALLGLLNGHLGRLDGGTLDHVIRSALTDEGFNPDVYNP